MEKVITRRLFLAFMQVHILHHAKIEPVFGLAMMEELQRHGYNVSPGTLYPLLHTLEEHGLLDKEERVVEGKVRKYYSLTAKGERVLAEAKRKTSELFHEIVEEG
ncbi:PadR family transcriptional regulator [Paradesulfitobacterium aromaticivorans]